MNNKLPLNDEMPETPGTGIKQNGKTHATDIDTFLNQELYKSSVQRIDWLKDVLGDVCPKTREEWVNGFLLCEYPLYAIHRRECQAFVYLKAISNTKLSLDDRKILFERICEMFDHGPSENIRNALDGYILVGIKIDMSNGLPSVHKICQRHYMDLDALNTMSYKESELIKFCSIVEVVAK